MIRPALAWDMTIRYRRDAVGLCPSIAGLLCLTLLTTHARAQGRPSPHETTAATIDGATISVSYGRPYMKGRTIMGGLVPFGQTWRTGADEATTLVTDTALMIGGAHLPAGSYTLFTLPGMTTWKLIINSETGQTGLEHDPARDIATVDATVGTVAEPVEQFTISLNDTPAGGSLVLSWELTEVTVPFTVH